MHPLLAGLRTAIRRRGHAPPGREPLTRLLLGEVVWALRQVMHPLVVVTAVVAVPLVVLLLGPSTNGPVLPASGRLAVGAMVAVVAMSVGHRLLQRRGDDADPLQALRVVLGGATVAVTATMLVVFILAIVARGPATGGDAVLDASLPIDGPLLVTSLLLLAGVLVAGIGHRVGMPGALLFLGLGLLVGPSGLGWLGAVDVTLVRDLSVAALVVILLDGGLSTDGGRLREGLGPGLSLATVGVGITAAVVALAAIQLFGLPTPVGLLVAAVVASTDASVVTSVLRVAPVPRRLAATLQVESGMNDPIAVLLTVGLVAASTATVSPGQWLTFGVVQMLGGMVVGTAFGRVGATLLNRVDLGNRALQAILALAVGGVAYGVAAWIGGSGFLAVYLTGLLLAQAAPRARLNVRNVVGALGSGVEVAMFLLLGLLVSPDRLGAVAVTGIGITVVLVLVARPLAAVVCLVPFGRTAGEITVTAWLGLRGAVPIVLATLALTAGAEGADTLLDVVFFVVLLSSLVQGASAAALVRRLDLVATPDPGPVVVEAIPHQSAGVDVVELRVPPHSPLVGARLRDIRLPERHLVTAIVRADEVVVPHGNTVLQVGDHVVVLAADSDDAREALAVWTDPDLAAHVRD